MLWKSLEVKDDVGLQSCKEEDFDYLFQALGIY